MAVPEGPTDKRYTGNGVTKIFTIPFLLLAATDLDVYIDGIEISSGFAITNVGSPTSTLTFTVAPADLADIYLQLNVPFERLNDYQENGDFLSSTVNRDFDRIWQALKQLFRWSTRSLRLGNFDVDGRGWYRAKGNGIRDLKDPEVSQDAATLGWSKRFFSELIESVSGLVNTTTGIFYDGGTLFDYLRSFLYRGVASIDAMCLLSTSRNQRVRVYSYYGDGKSDSRFFRWDPAIAKIKHNGGTVISPTVPRGILPGNLPAFIARVGETDALGFGCWVDENSNHELHVDQFGAIPGSAAYTVSNYAAIRAALSCAFTHYPTRLECNPTVNIGVGEYFVTGQSPLMLNRSEMIALPGAYRYRRGFRVKGCGRGASIITLVTAGAGELYFYSTKDVVFPGDTSVADYVTWDDFTCRGLPDRKSVV